MQTEAHFPMLIGYLTNLLRTLTENQELDIVRGSDQTVLMNSNFHSGFYLNRESFYDILKGKYNIPCIYDPCSYPGIQCKLYYNPTDGILLSNTGELNNNNDLESEKKPDKKQKQKHNKTNNTEITFMIFRTGSILIVGKCEEDVLRLIYERIKEIIVEEYLSIRGVCDNVPLVKNKVKKPRRKTIYVEGGPELFQDEVITDEEAEVVFEEEEEEIDME
jgi:hypothetical protein